MDERFMEIALEEAARARLEDEVPVGAVVVLSDVVIGKGHNSVLASKDPSAHAEVLAIRAAAGRLDNFRLIGATLYCTVEPCLMCLGAAMHARISRVVYGAPDLKVGAIGRLSALRTAGADFNHRFEAVGGVLADRAAALLLDFFREKRAAMRLQEAASARDACGEVPKWS
jgi:tRNA(adenine34) deaminase